MATAAVQQPRHAPGVLDEPLPEPRRRRWPWVVLAFFALLIAAVWTAPIYVAHSSWRDHAIQWLTSGIHGKVTVESVSLSWFSWPKVRGLKVVDEQGQSVLEGSQLTGERSLLAILWNPQRSGKWRVEEPKLNLVLRPDGSNLEDVLAGLLSAEGDSGYEFNLEIVNGSAAITDARTGQSWSVAGLQATIAMPTAADAPVTLKASGGLADEEGSGRFEIDLKWLSGEHSANGSELVIRTKSLPLAVFAPLAERWTSNARLDGRVTSDLRLRFDAGRLSQRVVAEGTVAAEKLVASAEAMGADKLALARLTAGGKVLWSDGRLELDKFAIESDIGTATLSGKFALAGKSTAEMLAALPYQTCEIAGQIDLARLATILPDTLRIQKGTQITSGHMQANLTSRPGRDGMTWQGHIEAANLTAMSMGRPLSWQQPVLITLAAHETAGGLIVESLDCRSDFFQLQGAGNPDNLTATLQFDLNQLAAQLAGFVDMGGLRLAGDGGGRFEWRRLAGEAFDAQGSLDVRDFYLGMTNRPSWMESRIVATLAATGRANANGSTRLDTATLGIEANGDRLDVRLSEPVLDMAEGPWTAEVASRGDLARWPPRLGPWLVLKDWQLAGQYDLTTRVHASTAAIELNDARLAVKQLQLRSPQLNLDEPAVDLAGRGSWEKAARRLSLPAATLASASLALNAENVSAAMPAEGPWELAGDVRYQGNLGRWQKWVSDASTLPTWHLAGKVNGQAVVERKGEKITSRFDAAIQDFAAVHPSGNRFDDPQVRLIGRGGYDVKSQSFAVDEVEMASAAARLKARGRYDLSRAPAVLDLEGQAGYDMEKLSGWLRGYLGDGVFFAGRGESPIWYRGPLSIATGKAAATLAWTWGEVYGFRVGPGQLKLNLSDGVLAVEPSEFEVSEGRARVAAQLRLSPEPRELAVSAGPILQQVRINPRMCAYALQYIAPVMAGAATAEGKFSLSLESCRVPIDDPSRGDLQGRMTVHTVEIGPGPLTQELALVLGRPSPAKLTRESVVPFRMVDGRIYHRDLELVFPDATIRTYGSVGLDQSMALMAEMPVPEKWRGNNVLGTALRDQKLNLPIAGTLGRPQLDRQTLDVVSRQFINKAAQNVIQDELTRQFNRFFPQPAPQPTPQPPPAPRQ